MSTKNCPKCETSVTIDAQFCPNCGASFVGAPTNSELMVVTTSTIPGYVVVKAMGVVHGMTVRTMVVTDDPKKLAKALIELFGGRL